MLSNVSKKLVCLMVAGVMLGVSIAEAGTIPTNNVPLYTYATKKIYCYNSPGGAQKGWIDPGDDITITKVQSDGWVYGNYPTPSGRVPRWFKASDLLADRAANYTRYSPTADTNVYRDSSYRSTMGSVNNNEIITVVGGSGNSRQIIYKLSNGTGYKMGWVPYWDCWTASQVPGRTFTNNTSSVVATTFSAPLSNYYVCGNDWGRYYSARQNHHLGLDIKSSTGDKNIYATADGKVVQAGWFDDLNGNTITIEHKLNGSTVYSFYAHLSKIDISNNTKVNRGQKIGVIGTTGAGSTGIHLHFAITNHKSAGTYGYGSVSGNIGTRAGYKFYNPKYVIQYGKLP